MAAKTKAGKKRVGVAQLKKVADKEFSRAVRYRDGEFRGSEWYCQCITCDEWRPLKSMQAGHFVSRAVNFLRYNSENVNAQCYSCNVMRYGEQYAYAKALDMKYGDGTAQKLHDQRHQTHKLTIEELESIIADAKETCAFYESQHANYLL